MKVVIIGGVAGGATAAARIRRLDEQAEIVVLERSGFISYANCGLPYYIGRVIQDQEELTLQTPQGFWDRFRIDVRVRHEATAIHREEKTVTVKNLETGEVTTESYDKLILAPGPGPPAPPSRGWTVTASFPCAPWRTPWPSEPLWSGRSPAPPCWPGAASSAWNWRRTWQRWGFR